MKNNITEIVFILDRSGSMSGLEDDTIGGFNAMIRKQKKQESEALVTTVLFNNGVETLHDRLKLEKIEPLTEHDYIVGGCTALYDAIGETIHHIEKIHRYIRPEDVPEHTIFIITTDGMENASREYDGPHVRRLIDQKKEADNWEFLFLGANIDALGTARDIGIDSSRAANYCCDEEGTQLNFRAMDEAIRTVRMGAPLTSAWKEEIDEDYRSRGKKER